MAIPKRLSCAIFDLDGTLASTNELIFATFNHVTRRHLGREYTPSEIIGFFGPPEQGAVHAMFGPSRTPEIMDELCAFYRDHHASMARLHDGMDDVLRFLRDSGVRLAVCTGKGRRTASITLEELGIADFFEMIVTGDDVVRYKPDPEGIRQILAAFSVPPDETIMVGDSMADVGASRQAGVAIAAVLWDAYDRQRVLDAGLDLVFETVPAFMDWCKGRINGHAPAVPPV